MSLWIQLVCELLFKITILLASHEFAFGFLKSWSTEWASDIQSALCHLIAPCFLGDSSVHRLPGPLWAIATRHSFCIVDNDLFFFFSFYKESDSFSQGSELTEVTASFKVVLTSKREVSHCLKQWLNFITTIALV